MSRWNNTNANIKSTNGINIGDAAIKISKFNRPIFACTEASKFKFLVQIAFIILWSSNNVPGANSEQCASGTRAVKICKTDPKPPAQTICFKDTAKNSEAWKEDNLPVSHRKIFRQVRTTRHVSHIAMELKGSKSGTAPIEERVTASCGFPTERAELGVKLDLRSKLVYFSDILCR